MSEAKSLDRSEVASNKLSTVRQKYLIRGLRSRLAKFLHRSGESSAQAEAEFARMKQEFEGAMSSFEAQQKSRLSQEVTDWDTRIDDAWHAMEKGTYHSVSKQEVALKQLKVQFKTDRDKEIKSYKKTCEATQADYEAAKPLPQKKMEVRKGEWNAVLERNGEAYVNCEQLLHSRSLRIPSEVLEDTDSDIPDSIPSAVRRINELHKEMEGLHREMRNHAIAKWSEGWRMWAIGILLGLAAGGISYALKLPFFTWLGIGGGTALGVSIIGLLALRPALAKMTRRLFLKARLAWDRSQKTHMVAFKLLEKDCLAEQNRLRDEFKTKLKNLETEHEVTLTKLQKQFDTETENVKTTEHQKRKRTVEKHTQSLREIQTEHKPKFEQLLQLQAQEKSAAEVAHQDKLQHLQKSFRQSLEYVRERFANGIAFARQAAAKQVELTHQLFPKWNDSAFWESPTLARNNDNAIIPLGSMNVSIGDSAASEANAEPLSATMPLFFRLIEDGCLIVESGPNQQAIAQACIKNVLVRSLASLPAGGFQTTIIDPDGLGKDYAWLMHLADTDPKMVNYRVWTQPNHISEQLGRLAHHTEDVIQQLLRDRYKDIREYNRDAGSMAEPYRLIVWSRFPVGLDENAWRFLSSLMASGGRCGVCVILQLDPTLQWPMMGDSRRLDGVGLRLRVHDVPSGEAPKIEVVDPEFSSFPVQLDEAPSDQRLAQLLPKCASEAMAGSRVEVPFVSLVPYGQPMGTESSADGLVIPLGQAGVGRLQYMRLGQGTAQHVLIAGKTGSGKSSLLHTMVTSAALRYSPDQLRLILLDFKKGVEFQAYSEAKIPHADIIGIESQREFGLSTLEYLDRVMQTRGEMFRASGVQDVGSWVRRNPTKPMPRILVVVDEFQELFVEDDKLAQQASMFLDRIVRQGRSFGMHVVLASQTLGGSYSLPRTTLAQMAVRIALQCEGSDAMIILSEDNLAAERLRHAGQAVYNDASGRIEGNQPFQVAYLSKSHQQERLAEIPVGKPFVDESNNSLGRCVVFEGHRSAIWENQAIEQAMELLPSRETSAIGAVVGDSVSIEPAVAIQLTRQAGRNFLIVGSEDRNAADAMAALMLTLTHSARNRLNTTPQIAFLDGSRPDDQYVARLPQLVRTLNPEAWIADVRSSEKTLGQVYEELQKRAAEPDVVRPPFFLTISQLGRFRELRKSDEFSFGGDDSGTVKPDVQLQEILRDGPGYGIHTIMWADNWNTVSRVVARQSMHDLELRILMQMSSNDSNHLIDSPIANRLDSHVMLVHDEASGLSRKFRPYRIEDFESSSEWAKQD